MKKLSIALLFTAITFSASAQRHFGGGFHGGGGFYHGGFYGPHIGFGIGYPYYSPFYYPYGYGYPYYTYIPSELDLEIKDIKNDYKQRIWEAKHQKGIPRSERMKNAHQLEYEEQQQIIAAERDYYNQHNSNNNNSNNGSNNSKDSTNSGH
jgi:hypothetical protein